MNSRARFVPGSFFRGELLKESAEYYRAYEVVIYDWPSAQANAKLSNNAAPLQTSYDTTQHALHVVIQDVAGEAELRVGD